MSMTFSEAVHQLAQLAGADIPRAFEDEHVRGAYIRRPYPTLRADRSSRMPSEARRTGPWRLPWCREFSKLFRTQSIRQRGPVLTGAMDRQTGAVFFGQDTGVPSPLHPELASALSRFTGAATPGKGVPGTHAEFNAINAGLFARPGSRISDFVFCSVRLRGAGQGEQILMCSNCSRILTGAEDFIP